ncbi:MAG: JAB domain-containing protein [Actinomycetota bacterium]
MSSANGTAPTFSMDELIDKLAFVVGKLDAEIVCATCINHDGTPGETKFFASETEPKNGLPLDEVFYLAKNSSAPAMLFTSTASAPFDQIHGCDIDFTKRLITAGAANGVEVIDHILVHKDEWVSLAESTDLWSAA